MKTDFRETLESTDAPVPQSDLSPVEETLAFFEDFPAAAVRFLEWWLPRVVPEDISTALAWLLVAGSIAAILMPTLMFLASAHRFVAGAPGGSSTYSHRSDVPDFGWKAQVYRGTWMVSTYGLLLGAITLVRPTLSALSATKQLDPDPDTVSLSALLPDSILLAMIGLVLIGAHLAFLAASFLLPATALQYALRSIAPLKVTVGKPQAEEARGAAEKPVDHFAPIAQRHDRIRDEWARWHTDLDLITAYPAFHDVRHEDFAARLVEATVAVDAARTASAAKLHDKAAADRFAKAVTAFDHAFEEAKHQAIALGTEAIDPVLARVVEKATVILEQMRDERRQTWERRGAAKRLVKVLEPLIGESDTATTIPELETAMCLELE